MASAGFRDERVDVAAWRFCHVVFGVAAASFDAVRVRLNCLIPPKD